MILLLLLFFYVVGSQPPFGHLLRHARRALRLIFLLNYWPYLGHHKGAVCLQLINILLYSVLWSWLLSCMFFKCQSTICYFNCCEDIHVSIYLAHMLLSARNSEHFCWCVKRDFFQGNIFPQWQEYSARPWTTSMCLMSSCAVGTYALHRQHWTVKVSLQLFWCESQLASSIKALLQMQHR